jgi:hypothetical protein
MFTNFRLIGNMRDFRSWYVIDHRGETYAAASGAVFYVALLQNTGDDCRRVTLVHTVNAKIRELQCLDLKSHPGKSGACMRLRCPYVRNHGLENRQGFTAFVSSNLTLSAT